MPQTLPTLQPLTLSQNRFDLATPLHTVVARIIGTTSAPSPSISGVHEDVVAIGTGEPFVPLVTGGAAPYRLELVSGALPPGRTLSQASAIETGTYTTAGSYTYSVRAVDANSESSQALQCSVTVEGLPTFSIDPVVRLTGGIYTFTARRSGTPLASVSASFQVGPSTEQLPAALIDDFGGTFPSGQITFSAGSSTATFQVAAPTEAVLD